MKYLKTYESIISKLFSKNKFEKTLVEFLNKIDPSLECFIQKSHYGINIVSEKYKKTGMGIHTAGWLLTLEKKYRSDEFGTDEILEITIHSHKGFEKISEFFRELFHTTHAVAEIDTTYINSYIEKLTEKNYKNFLLRKDADKYNL